MFNCYPSAGIIRIRFAGRELKELLSAWQHQAPRASYCYIYKQYKLLFKNVKLDQKIRRFSLTHYLLKCIIFLIHYIRGGRRSKNGIKGQFKGFFDYTIAQFG